MTAVDPARAAGWTENLPRKGFFTDTSVCIGCKACEVACKEWNQLPEDGLDLLGSSYDNTGALGATTWRHVAFIEQKKPPVSLGIPGFTKPGEGGDPSERNDFRWLMASDVCKHCTEAGCLDVCPTGALFRSEFGTVVVQDDICNGCGYCVAACPFGVIDRRISDHRGPVDDLHGAARKKDTVGMAQKCTLCYDRLLDDQTPACAKACPTQSIQFGDVDELRERAAARVATLHERGETDARLYGADPESGVGGTGSIFLLLDEPEVYGLPPDPIVTTRDVATMWRRAAAAAGAMLAATALSFLGRRR